MRTAARRLALFFVAVLLAVAAGTLVPRPLWPSAPDAPKPRRILVLTNPIHTDVALPLDAETAARFSFLEGAGVPVGHPEAAWLIFGWGGRAFYLETPTWADLKPGPVMKALTMDRSVMHVDVATAALQSADAAAVFEVGDAGFERLLDCIDASFERAAEQPLLIPDASYWQSDRFFEANGRFNALLGCNTWTARALREAGLRTGWWNPLPVTLALSLRLHN